MYMVHIKIKQMNNRQDIQEIFENQDLGIKTVEKVVDIVEDQNTQLIEELDNLTAYITEAYLDADDKEEYNSAIDYAINQLKIAKL